MNTTRMNFLLKHGYEKVKENNIKNILLEGNIKDLHINIARIEPAMLLARVNEKNAIVSYDKMYDTSTEYLAITMTDEFKTCLFDVPLNNMKNTLVKFYPCVTEIIFNLSTDDNNYSITFKRQ